MNPSHPPSYAVGDPTTAIMAATRGESITKLLFQHLLRAHDLVFQEYVSFSNCHFQGVVDLSRCRFQKGLEFVGCAFESEVLFEGVRIDGDFHLRACRFSKKARFDRMQINGKLEARAPRSKRILLGNDDGFESKPYVAFESGVSFSQIRVSGEANFGSAQFSGETDFYNARIEGPVFFRVDYCKTAVNEGGFPNYDEEIFPCTHFKKGDDGRCRARFRDVFFGSELNFDGATFDVDADFSYVRCLGIAFFRSDVRKLNRKGITEQITRPCKFGHKVDFEGAQFATSLRLDGSEYAENSNVVFLDCRISETLAFGKNFPLNAVLTDCSYKRLSCDQPCAMIKRMGEFERLQKRFDRSSWVQLEATYRNSGELGLADKVYIKRMRQQCWLAGPTWRIPFSLLWDFCSAYGISTLRLAILAFAVFAIGLWIFYRSPMEHNPESKAQIAAKTLPTGLVGDTRDSSIFRTDANSTNPTQSDDTCKDPGGQLKRAVATSLSDFLPIKVPIDEQCRPSPESARVYAVLEKIAGWMLVPLLVASLTGLLNRRTKASFEAQGGED